MKEPKILLYDIESAPNLAYVWGKYEQDVLAYTREWYMLSFSWKWLGESKTHVLSLPDFKTYKKDPENDIELIRELWQLFDEADIIIAHNGNSFDQKKTNARFIFHGFPPPTPYKEIDTKLVAKRYFNFNSNKLDDLGKYFKIGQKLQTGGFELWQGCMRGDKKAWKTMTDYNKMDVILLEKVYEKMKPWMNNHPNIGLMNGELRACPNCGSSHLHRRGTTYTRTGSYQRLQCQDCGAWSQSGLKDNSQVR